MFITSRKFAISILSFLLYSASIYSADFKYGEEQEFLEFIDNDLIEEDLDQLENELKSENKNENKNNEVTFIPEDKEFENNESKVEEIPATPEILTKIGELEVPESEYAQSMIRKYMGIYTSIKGSQNLNYVLIMGEPYRVFIRHKLIEYELPRALEYLPIVESEFKLNATSRSGAKGIWQFMENSMKPFLKKNDWVDERLDPWKSTEAALKKLKDNYNMFGDWALALAAYNCGAGAMKKITKAHPDMDFWQLAEQGYLKKQTVHYVPKLLGITELCERPENYELELPKIEDDAEEIQYDFATTKKPINLAKLASELKINIKTIKSLNPSLIRNVTPPSTNYQIRLPYGMAEQGQIAVDNIQKSMKGNANLYIEHKIASGDTLWGLSRIYGCKVDDICDLNGITQKTVLKLGKTLYIPMK